jgi:23S rRNA (guanine2445-N2)-methyltransferase / 23S rRNA (guanine2069-N7)-methyltransferase
VRAALGGARSTTSVDLSNTYRDWAARNLALNDLDGTRHRLVRADCQRYLAEPGPPVDLIFLNPPTRSRSSAMDGGMELHRDHPTLIQAAYRRLAPGGVLLFSTHARGFEPDREALAELALDEITDTCMPRDFQRRPAFRAFRLERPH